ncbi:pectinesterase inhibitor 7-like [Musa acuminata AAA Group]|uniref:pectinesterase inhibitor 7-like n=1 Tax=Musa acuminata AAA Group TaxID=214697 RepID=UPI0031DF27FB
MECHRNSATTTGSLSCLCVLLLLFSVHLKACNGARVAPQDSKSTEFIRASCAATMYPDLCFSSLSSYASTIRTSPVQLADVALSVSLAGARSASAAMSRSIAGRGMAPRVAAAVKDCLETMGDSVDELRESLAAMGHVAGRNAAYQINSIQTWVSAALTDEDTCVDGFAGGAMDGEVKNMVRSHVVYVAQLSSNALALVNGLATSISRP